ncbi:hypothetical protein ARMGADRAFT_1039626 [Armillaria gallica]|uniref:Uncharacterized protein n=1 Tax=Armillaria gallica TaxID=47427 RepID=A0A2H3CRJ1_ARMGA|nr:hypothetical protein ARMGADRAFT_1039626 [Armillaria gallica]
MPEGVYCLIPWVPMNIFVMWKVDKSKWQVKFYSSPNLDNDFLDFVFNMSNPITSGHSEQQHSHENHQPRSEHLHNTVYLDISHGTVQQDRDDADNKYNEDMLYDDFEITPEILRDLDKVECNELAAFNAESDVDVDDGMDSQNEGETRGNSTNMAGAQHMAYSFSNPKIYVHQQNEK